MPDRDRMSNDCLELRNTIIEMAHKAGSGHCGGSLSCVEILWTLYSQVMNIRPESPKWPDRDRFILSKGHAAPTLYAVLAKLGFFEQSELMTLRQTGSMLQGHPDMRKTPGVEMSTGSLGMGISAGVGMAIGARLSNRSFRVYVLVGDGELQEGQNWEAIACASKYHLENLTVIVDHNGVQLDGPVEEVMPMGDLAEKLRQFGLHITECDGHDCGSLLATLTKDASGPRGIIAHTVKGKGVSFMEGQAAWHGKPLMAQDYDQAKSDLAEAT